MSTHQSELLLLALEAMRSGDADRLEYVDNLHAKYPKDHYNNYFAKNAGSVVLILPEDMESHVKTLSPRMQKCIICTRNTDPVETLTLPEAYAARGTLPA
jgi:hypothetical protein